MTINGPVQVDGEIWTLRITGFCVCAIVSVGLLDVFFFYLEWLPSEVVRRSFDISKEESYGTWVSTSLALLTGGIAAAVCACFYQRGILKRAIGWAIVSMFFVFVSFDDAAKFHERLGTAIRVKAEIVTGTELVSWFPSWGWQIYVLPLFIAMGLYLCWFFWGSVASRLRIWIWLGFACLGVAVAIDFFEGVLDRNDVDINHFMRLTEELLEMFGTTAFLYVFLATLSENATFYISTAHVETESPQSDSHR